MLDHLETAQQRCEQLRHVAQKLADEKESLQARMKGAETLGLLLHDTQTENATLKQKVERLESALERLDDQNMFIRKAGAGQAPQSVGASRRVVEGLVKDNAKLQQEVQRLRAGDTSLKKEDWVLVTGELRKENDELRSELNTTKTALQSLSSGDFSGDDSNSSSPAAAAELVRLSKRLAHAERLVKTKDVLIEGLTKQLTEIRQERDSLVSQVAHLQQQHSKSVANAGMGHTEDVELVKELQRQLKEKDVTISDLQENLEIETRDKNEALVVTNDWDAYCKEQQADLIALRERNARLEGELEEFHTAQDTRKREVDKVLMSAKAIVDRERQEKLAVQAELKKAKDRCEMLEGKFNMLEEEFKSECSKRQKLEQEMKGVKNRSEDGDRIALLEQQVQLYKEDFETERSDRERLQSEKESIQDELNTAQLTIHRQREHVRSLEEDLRVAKEKAVQMPRDRPTVSTSRDRQPAGVVPLSDYDRRMAIEYQKRIEDQIKRQSVRQRPWPPGQTESDLVPRGFVGSGAVTRDGPSADSLDTENLLTDSNSKEEVELDCSPDFEQRLPYSSMTTGSRPVTQPTSDGDLESSVSILGGHQMVTRPSQPFSSLAAHMSGSSTQSNDSQPASLGMLYSRPEDNLKNSMAPKQKGKGSLLVCPRCAASFSPKQGRDYIDHVDQCCSQP